VYVGIYVAGYALYMCTLVYTLQVMLVIEALMKCVRLWASACQAGGWHVIGMRRVG
jgi:hypothetical protein